MWLLFTLCHNDLKFLYSVDTDQTATEKLSDQGLHILPFSLHQLDARLYGKTPPFNF